MAASKSEDLTFSSSSEIRNFVRSRLEKPSDDGGLLQGNYTLFRVNSDLPVSNSAGEDLLSQRTFLQNCLSVFRMTFLNPVAFNGQVWRQVEDAYTTNEVGFFISLSFFGAVAWAFSTYRRNVILTAKKRFLFQQYKRHKFLEETL